ncbi:hypothetical protein SAMN05443574_103246 [Haloarcula vallismortis]|uniref:Uncharacterized protein n=2 Tax=Haloarcula vallismortis TaxID=28442 RepID=M0JT63_HALVA|nr:hypothetical protein [Haloarcula vallismortis]EMA11543.1 hypothetical protein C437_01485 [Haloarcula vallismortis ATCC 29715]SDW44174.1 hypothetical protein SAMN05443574_103246 [Haloarcula vallismortis]
MSDGEALEELAAAMYHLQMAEAEAETESIQNMLKNSLDDLDMQAQEILMILGEKEYQSGEIHDGSS